MPSLPRSQFVARRLRHFLVLGIVCVLGAVGIYWLEGSLARTSYATGYVMYGAVLFLAGYQLRKKLPGLPLGSSAMWMQLHLYVGIGSALLLAAHTGMRWPTGWLETSLATIYLATFTSGVCGLYLTRSIPRQLARTADQVVFERIPKLREGLLDDSRSAVLVAASQSGQMTLADFYTAQLDPYLATNRGLTYFLRPTSGLRRRLLSELSDLRRFLSDAEVIASERIFAAVRKKDDLDFHSARQGLLKGWLFFHITLTWVLILLGTLHGIVALAMQGGPT